MATVCPQYMVRKATRDDVPAVCTLTEEEGWEFGMKFLYCVYDLDGRAWFVAEADTGEIMGVRAFTYFNDEITAGGIYIVKEKYRGHGVGRAVNAAALKSVEDSNIIISATDVNLYNTRGFTLDYQVHLIRLNAGTLMNGLPVAHIDSRVTIQPYNDTMLSDVQRYDTEICKHTRPKYFENWNISQAQSILVAGSKFREVVGYGCLRLTEYGHQLAPVYADTNAIAWFLIRGLLEKLDRCTKVDLFVSSKNESIMTVINALSHENVVTLTKMYNRKNLDVPLSKVYSLSSMGLSAL